MEYFFWARIVKAENRKLFIANGQIETLALLKAIDDGRKTSRLDIVKAKKLLKK